MVKECSVCPYGSIPVGDYRIHCHHPFCHGEPRVMMLDEKCILDNGLDESIIQKVFLDDDCKIATCTGLSYSTFKRIALYFWNMAKECD